MDYSILKQQILNDVKSNKRLYNNNINTYAEVGEYSKVLGSAVSNSIQKNIPKEGIPVEELGLFANECLAPIYKQSQNTMLNMCSGVQKKYNASAGVNLNPVNVKRDESRIEHIIDRFEDAENFEDVKFLTDDNVVKSITRGAVTQSIEENAAFQKESGLNIVISRSDGGGCCDWCASVCGVFNSFESLPDNFWAIHRNCSCVIDYKVGKTNAKIKYKTNSDGTVSKSNPLNMNLQFFGINPKIIKKSEDASNYPTINVKQKGVYSAITQYLPLDTPSGIIDSKEYGNYTYTFECLGGKEFRIIKEEPIPEAVTELFERIPYKKDE